MRPDTRLTFTPVDHPDVRIRRIGFELDDPYVEQCWSASVGPSSIALLRRMPTLWIHQVPAEITAGELAGALGLGAGVGDRSRFANTLERVNRFGLVRRVGDGDFDVYRQVAPLSPRQLDQAPRWTVDTHERLYGAHLAQLETSGAVADPFTQLSTRLDRLQRPNPPVTIGSGPQSGGLAP